MSKLQLILCLCLSLLASCGAKKIAVKYADTYIEKQVEKRLPLYDGQEEKLSQEINKFLNDHKARIKKLIPIIDEIDLSRASSLDEVYPKLTAAYLDIAGDFSKILAKHMSVFDENQTRKFLKNMREENNEIFLRDKKQRKTKIEERVKSLLGSLTDEQKKILKDNASAFDQQVIERSERRSKLHTELKEILEQDISSETKEKMIYDAFTANQKEALASNQNLEIAKAFIPTLKPAQKKNIKGRLAELQEILTYFLETAY
jgi:hypothetical protein